MTWLSPTSGVALRAEIMDSKEHPKTVQIEVM